MIDLKLLEAEIDIVLENETTDTLLNWLYDKRISDMKKRFGNGIFETLSNVKPIENKRIKNDVVVAILQPYNNVLSSNDNTISACYDIAA
jgi:hypothetical protein